MDYIFNVNVNYPSYMQMQIAALGLAVNLIDVETDASTSPMTVDLTFDAALSGGDQTTLSNYMGAYIDPFVSSGAITAILTALNTDANVMIIARAKIKQTVPFLDVITLLQVCTLLGINPNT